MCLYLSSKKISFGFVLYCKVLSHDVARVQVFVNAEKNLYLRDKKQLMGLLHIDWFPSRGLKNRIV